MKSALAREGEALGLERAGFRHIALVENDAACCETLRAVKAGRCGVRNAWKSVVEQISLKRFYAGDLGEPVDLFAGGVPGPPFSRAGQGLGADDDRDLFPTAIKRIKECAPRAVLLENVRGLLHERFDEYRENVIIKPLTENDEYVSMGWRILEAKDFGVPQLRPRTIMVALRGRR